MRMIRTTNSLVFILLVVAVLAVYLFLTDFSLVLRFTQDGEFIESIKKFVGYNVPKTTDQPTVSKPDIDSDDNGLGFLKTPNGFKISVAASGLTNPRVILFDARGRILVSETKGGRVSVLEDPEPSPVASYGAGKDNYLKTRRTLIECLRSPHGLAFFVEGEITYLYIAETHQVARYPYDINTGKLLSTAGQNIATLPADGRHFTRTISFGRNTRDIDLVGEKVLKGLYSKDKLYISVGSSCDVCVEDSWKRAAILESDPEGTVTAEFAGGLRNSVFFTFHPETGEMWATEMGRDNLGDDLPPDEINIIKPAGPEQKFGARRFGWPFCYGDRVEDETFKPEKVERTDIPTDCSKTDAPVIEIPAHSAPLGLAFIPKAWGQFSGDLLVAYHGSWNRSEPTGYKIVKFKVDNNGKVSETTDFITGWLDDNENKIYGRPVDLKFGPDGALYISDDTAGVIYKAISNL